MTLNATYSTTTPAFRLTTTPDSGVALPATDPSQYGNRPLAAFLQATTHDMRFTTDGSVPTSSHGMVLTAGAAPFLYAGSLVDLRFIQAASGSVLNVVYAEIEDTVGPQGPPGQAGVSNQPGPPGPRGSPGGASDWSYATQYQPGDVVFDRGGTWRAYATNSNSEPISGNANWTLIGGTPYVDRFYSTLELRALHTTAIQHVPTPGANNALLLERVIASSVATEEFSSSFFNISIGLGAIPANYIDPIAIFYQSSAASNPTSQYITQIAASITIIDPGQSPPDWTDQPIMVQSPADVTGGDGQLWLRVYYNILYNVIPVFP